MMADRVETQQPNGNSSSRRTNGLDGDAVAGSVRGFDAPVPTQSHLALTQRRKLPGKLADSQQQREQPEADLKATKRRLQQLIGERNRLTTLLAERDAQLQRLNRELGALTERTRSAVRRSPTLLETARAIFEKIRPVPAVRGAKPRSATPEVAQRASPAGALVPWVANAPPKAILGVVVFGLSEAEIEKVLVAIEAYCGDCGLAPLLLTDTDAFQVFRGRRVLFEFLPAPSDQERLAPELEWRLYTLRRLALIRRKWQPVRVVAFGHRAAEVVKLWRDSPFEVTPIPAALNGSSATAEFPRSPALLGAW